MSNIFNKTTVRKIITIILTTSILILMLLPLSGCGRSYSEAHILKDSESWGHGYFTMIKAWSDSDHNYYIVYANDTKVLHFVFDGNYGSGITPLYNTDGTLQVYDENVIDVNSLVKEIID